MCAQKCQAHGNPAQPLSAERTPRQAHRASTRRLLQPAPSADLHPQLRVCNVFSQCCHTGSGASVSSLTLGTGRSHT